jgi:hypothetical protein
MGFSISYLYHKSLNAVRLIADVALSENYRVISPQSQTARPEFSTSYCGRVDYKLICLQV